MSDRIVDIAQRAASLRIELERLRIDRDGADPVHIPLADLAAVVVSHRDVRLSQSVLARLAAYGGVFVVIDEQYQPAAMMLPLDGHTTASARMRKQAAAPLPTRKRVWRALVRAKIRAQWSLLRELGLESDDGEPLVARVRSGDPDNIEATAAGRYWKRLFGPAFRRDRDADDQNRLLNYGYAVLRATTARALCAAGLHPALGVHHHNQYSAFCLADDLMEPFRPLIDRAVCTLVRERGPAVRMDADLRGRLIAPAVARYTVDGESRAFFDLLAQNATALAKVLTGQARDLVLKVP